MLPAVEACHVCLHAAARFSVPYINKCAGHTASCFPAGCGCPPGWELGLRGPAPGEPQYRPADLVDFLLHRSFRNFQQVARPSMAAAPPSFTSLGLSAC